MFVNWDDDIPNVWENKTCSKPPTRKTWENDGFTAEQYVFLVWNNLWLSQVTGKMWVYPKHVELNMGSSTLYGVLSIREGGKARAKPRMV